MNMKLPAVVTTPYIYQYVSIANTLRTDTSNLTDPTVQPTIAHLNQSIVPGHSDRNHFTIRSLNSIIDVPRYGRNIDNRTGVNP